MAAIAKNRKFDQKTLVEWSLSGPLLELYPMTPPANQDGRH